MLRTAIIIAIASTPAIADEMCAVVIPNSAVDQAFISAINTSRIKHSRPRAEWICFDETDRAAVSELRATAHSENPQACVTFEHSSQLEAAVKELQHPSVPNWREKPKTLCYLVKDAATVEKAVKRAVRASKGE
jgi:hypothetical protein